MSDRIECRVEDCIEAVDNSRWPKIRAHDLGWFFQKDDTAWCPEHNPPWVAGWRKKQRTEERRRLADYADGTCLDGEYSRRHCSGRAFTALENLFDVADALEVEGKVEPASIIRRAINRAMKGQS